MLLATEAMPETRLHFCHFPAVCYSCKIRTLQTTLPAKRARPNHISLATCQIELRATFLAISPEKLAHYPVQGTYHCGAS